ncbi:hypothetical protein M6B38_325570 [Iris pallida]|uniref:Uncharacterized protein n=1 Tax=Iris pallida TaxID=29817 RepID=A0AAX6H7E1_IRIPA|nr:hypothetical protein M6B38_325570 [Iris pallida]
MVNRLGWPVHGCGFPRTVTTGAPGPFGLGGNYVWYLWCTSFGRIATVQCCDKL